jgi:hypothetical protein
MSTNTTSTSDRVEADSLTAPPAPEEGAQKVESASPLVAALPDPAVLARLANEFFAALPGATDPLGASMPAASPHEVDLRAPSASAPSTAVPDYQRETFSFPAVPDPGSVQRNAPGLPQMPSTVPTGALNARLQLRWLAQWHSCPKFQLQRLHPRCPTPRHLLVRERRPAPGPLHRTFHLWWKCFLFLAFRQFLRHSRPLRRAGRIWQPLRRHQRPRPHPSLSLRRHIRRQALRATGTRRIHTGPTPGRSRPISRMKFSLSPVFRVGRPQAFRRKVFRNNAFPKQLCRNRVHR